MTWFEGAAFNDMGGVNRQKIKFHRESKKPSEFKGWTAGDVRAMHNSSHAKHKPNPSDTYGATTIIVSRPNVSRLTSIYRGVGVTNFLDMKNEHATLVANGTRLQVLSKMRRKKTTLEERESSHLQKSNLKDTERIRKLKVAMSNAQRVRQPDDPFFALLRALPSLSNANYGDPEDDGTVTKDCEFWATKRNGWCEVPGNDCKWEGILSGYLTNLFETSEDYDTEDVTDIALVVLNVGSLYEERFGVSPLTFGGRKLRSSEGKAPLFSDTTKARALIDNALTSATPGNLARWLDMHCGAYASLDRNHVVYRTLTRDEKQEEYDACRDPLKKRDTSIVYRFPTTDRNTFVFEQYNAQMSKLKKLVVKKQSEDNNWTTVNSEADFKNRICGTSFGLYIHAICSNPLAWALTAEDDGKPKHVVSTGGLLLAQLDSFDFLFTGPRKTIALTAASSWLKTQYYGKRGFKAVTGILKQAHPDISHL
jgi:hypothetical protein